MILFLSQNKCHLSNKHAIKKSTNTMCSLLDQSYSTNVSWKLNTIKKMKYKGIVGKTCYFSSWIPKMTLILGQKLFLLMWDLFWDRGSVTNFVLLLFFLLVTNFHQNSILQQKTKDRIWSTALWIFSVLKQSSKDQQCPKQK